MTAPGPPVGRKLRVWQFVVLVVGYLVIVQGLTLLLGAGSAHGSPSSVEYLVTHVVVPVGVGIAFTVGVVAWLGWWQEVFVDRRPLRRWVLVVPVLILLTVVVITHYGGLAAKGATFTLLLLVATLMVGFGEELLFRGVGVAVFRRNGHREFTVGLWTTVIFGLAHGTNILTAGPSALLQVVLTSGTGFLFYLVLRSTGLLVAAMAAHGLWDFAVLSTQVDPANPSPLVNLAAVVLVAILLLVLVLRKRLAVPDPSATSSPVTGSPTSAATTAHTDDPDGLHRREG